MQQGEDEKYQCIHEGCTTMIIFTAKQREEFIQKNWVDSFGNPTKPRRCKAHRIVREVQ